MRQAFLKSQVLVILLAAITVMVVTTAMTNDNETSQATSEQQLFEWDGTILHTRSVYVSPETEQEFLDEWNTMNREQARIGQLYQSGQLPETPESNVIETEHGIVTVEKTIAESNPIIPAQAEISVEIEQAQTPYGTITIEKQSFDGPVSEVNESTVSGDSGVQPMGLSEYTDTLYETCGSNGVEFNFGSNNTQSNYELHWSGGSYADYVVCSSSSCTFKITTSWAAYYTYAKAYTTSPGYVYGFGFDDYRCR